MTLKNEICAIGLFFLFTQISCFAFAQESGFPQDYLFRGEVKRDNINIRSDSTINSEVICTIDKGEAFEVVAEVYDWYKIRLPYNAPSFIKKDFVELNKDGQTGRAIGNNVNIRLKPDTSSAILGRLNEFDTVEVSREQNGWYRIRPTKFSFGFIHRSVVRKITAGETKSRRTQEPFIYSGIIVEGLAKPKIFTRIASHKLITPENKVYLLKADTEALNPFNNRKVKITGKLIDPAKQKYPIIEVEKIEAID